MKIFQEERTGSAKALMQEPSTSVQKTIWNLIWLEHSEKVAGNRTCAQRDSGGSH